MTDSDDDALTWDGDDRVEVTRRPAPKLIDDRPAEDGRAASGGGVSLLALGLLGGIAVIETVLWVRGLLQPALVASLGTPRSATEQVVYWVNVATRVLAAAAPVVWYGVVVWRVRRPSTRLGWLLIGAVLLVPWPFVLGAL